MSANKPIDFFGPPQPFLASYGKINFGGCIAPIAVDWFEKGKWDIIVGCYGGTICLFERIGGTSEKPVFAEPVVIASIPSIVAHPIIFDWNRDGTKDMLAAGNNTMIYLLENVGTDKEPKLELAGPLKDTDGLVFSIEYHHPDHEMSDLGEYTDIRFFDELSPTVCDWYDDGGDDLLIGDGSGVVWIMEDISQGIGMPRYEGEKYRKTAAEPSAFIEEYGEYFSKPTKILCYADGSEIREGWTVTSDVRVHGATSRPVVCDWDGDGDLDLLMASGEVEGRILFIENTGLDEQGSPRLVNRGPITSDNGVIEVEFHNHFLVDDWNDDGFRDLIVSTNNHLIYYENKRKERGIPELAYRGPFCAPDVRLNVGIVRGSVDWNGNGLPDLLEGDSLGFVSIRENTGSLENPRFANEAIHLCDENGPVRVYGECDPNKRREGGLSRPDLVDWNNDGVLDLIVGADTGHVYYYQGIAEPGKRIPKHFRSKGQLKDSTGKVIKVHNRASPICYDINGNGRLDLLVGGASYQEGVRTDPHVGGDIQVFENTGMDENGDPILAPGYILEVDGKPFVFDINRNCVLQKGDIDRDGIEEIVVWVGSGGGLGTRVIRNAGSATEPRWTLAEEIEGTVLRGLTDVNGDGWPDAVFGGGSRGQSVYRPNIERP